MKLYKGIVMSVRRFPGLTDQPPQSRLRTLLTAPGPATTALTPPATTPADAPATASANASASAPADAPATASANAPSSAPTDAPATASANAPASARRRSRHCFRQRSRQFTLAAPGAGPNCRKWSIVGGEENASPSDHFVIEWRQRGLTRLGK